MKQTGAGKAEFEAPKPASPGWERLRRELEDRRSRISTEISEYPSPIAGCDAHINHLLAERDQVSEELARLEEAARRGLASSDPQSLIDEFIKSSRLK
jgi:chorismate mutase